MLLTIPDHNFVTPQTPGVLNAILSPPEESAPRPKHCCAATLPPIANGMIVTRRRNSPCTVPSVFVHSFVALRAYDYAVFAAGQPTVIWIARTSTLIRNDMMSVLFDVV